MHAGAKVRLYPVAENLQVDPDRIEPLITAHTRAVYVTHYFGIIQPCLAELRALCDRYGLRLIEDCALSLLSGASPVEGYIGDVSVFCFHKFLPVLEGGALIINAPGLARINLFQRPPPRGTVKKKLARALIVNALGSSRTQKLLRMMRGKAFIADLTAEDADVMVDIPSHYYFDPALQGMRISLWAARSLRGVSVSEVISARRANWNRYREQLDGMRGVRMLTPDLLPQTCPLNMPIMVADRDRVAQKLQARGIGVTPWWAGFSRHVDWTGQEEAIMLKNSVVALPLHQFLSDEHVDYIVSELAKLV
jgi:dTDP-4-amino-4,6-dideoxygalactose transaminase